jgi:hypothetical protein
MTNISRFIPSGAHASLIISLLALLPYGAHAAVIYSEGFDNPALSSVSTFGWTAYRDNGTNLSTSTVDPLLVAASASQVTISSGGGFLGLRTVLISDAGTIDPTDYTSDLTISFTESGTNAGANSPAMGWRALAQVGTTIYVSNFIGFTESTGSPASRTRNVVVSDSIWSVWTSESNLTDGFNIANIAVATGTLPTGDISGFGILAIDGADNNDRMRVFDYSITGTAIPEPGSALLGGLGMLALLLRRR